MTEPPKIAHIKTPQLGDRTNGDAVDIIENEGIAYAVMHYIDGNEFKDGETAFRWRRAALALELLKEHLEKETGREIDG
jgi:hypothetical protein